MKHITLVNVLAAQIRKSCSRLNRSESMKIAWLIVKTTPTAKLLVFVKKSTGTTERRVVAQNWFDFQAPVGGRSTNAAGQMLFADLGKWATGTNCIISTYQQNIVTLA